MAAIEADLPLRTERLLLRPLERGDAAALTRLVNDYSVAGNLARVPFPYREGLAEEWIASSLAQIEAGTAWHLAITRDDKLVGCVGLSLKRDALPELGYWVGRKFWGQGIAREAAAALLDWAGQRMACASSGPAPCRTTPPATRCCGAWASPRPARRRSPSCRATATWR
jgi:8-oxo-dGTP diphosphatase